MVNANCDIIGSTKYDFISLNIKVSCNKDTILIELNSLLHAISSINIIGLRSSQPVKNHPISNIILKCKS